MATLAAAADRFAKQYALNISSCRQEPLEPMLAAARASIGAEAFASSWEKGDSMTLEEALAFALPSA